MAKKRTYSLRLVRDNYTYAVQEIADLYGLDISTVRNWIKKGGLKRIPKARPHLVHSSALKLFLNKRQKKRKRPCAPDEIYCCSCKKSHPPKMGSARAQFLPNGSVRIQAICPLKNKPMNRLIKGKDWSKKHPLAKFLQEATKQHNGAQCSPPKYQLQQGEQLCLNITL